MRYLVPVGRLFYSLIFILAYQGHFSSRGVDYAAQSGVPLPAIAVPLSGVLAVCGGLSVALGFHASWGARLLVLFLVPVTLMMHNFWAVKDPMAAGLQKVMFEKNLSMLGGALIISYFGSGPCSLDTWLRARRAQPAEEGADG